MNMTLQLVELVPLYLCDALLYFAGAWFQTGDEKMCDDALFSDLRAQWKANVRTVWA